MRDGDEGANAGALVREIIATLEFADCVQADTLKRRVFERLEQQGIDVNGLRLHALKGKLDRAKARRGEWEARLGALLERSGLLPSEPTPERTLRSGEAPVSVPAIIPSPFEEAKGPPLRRRTWSAAPPSSHLPRAYKYEWPVENLKPVITQEQYNAAVRLRDAYVGMGGRSAIVSYGDAGMHGGDITPTQLQVNAIQEFRALWHAEGMTDLCRRVLRNFVLEEAPPSCASPHSLKEAGKIWRGTSCDRRAMGVAEGLLLMALSLLEDACNRIDRQRREKARAAVLDTMKRDPHATLVRDGPSGSLWDDVWLRKMPALPRVTR